MSQPESASSRHSNAYNLYMIVLTVLSLAIMAVMLLPVSDSTLTLLVVYDNAICILFLIDFVMNLKRAPTMRTYFIDERGWLDLLGSIPSFGFFKYAALFRLARISRLTRITRLTRTKNKHEMIDDVLHNRGKYAVVITLLLTLIVLVVCSILVLQAESRSAEANITTGGDAVWWGIVTITTVGYGDRYPVTAIGRFIGVVVMVAGVGIIASLASILTSILVPPAKAAIQAAPVAAEQATREMPPASRDEFTPFGPIAAPAGESA